MKHAFAFVDVHERTIKSHGMIIIILFLPRFAYQLGGRNEKMNVCAAHRTILALITDHCLHH